MSYRISHFRSVRDGDGTYLPNRRNIHTHHKLAAVHALTSLALSASASLSTGLTLSQPQAHESYARAPPLLGGDPALQDHGAWASQRPLTACRGRVEGRGPDGPDGAIALSCHHFRCMHVSFPRG